MMTAATRCCRCSASGLTKPSQLEGKLLLGQQLVSSILQLFIFRRMHDCCICGPLRCIVPQQSAGPQLAGCTSEEQRMGCVLTTAQFRDGGFERKI